MCSHLQRKLFEVDGKLEIMGLGRIVVYFVVLLAPVILREDIRGTEHIDLQVGAPGRVVLMVPGVKYDTSLELEVASSVHFTFRNDVVPDILLEQGGRPVDQAFVLGAAGRDVPVGKTGRPAPFAVPEVALEAGHDPEDVTAHQEPSEAILRNLVDK